MLCVVLASGASGEGAVRVLDCTTSRICDAAGNCEPEAAERTFRWEPIQTQADGAGTYTLTDGDTEVPMQALSDAGPFFWSVGSQRNTLLVSSETQFVWHRLTLEPVPEGTVAFLTCAFRQ